MNLTQTNSYRIEKAVAVPARLHIPLYADLLTTVRFFYQHRDCTVSEIKVKLEHTGWGIRGLSYSDTTDVLAYYSPITRYITFSVDFTVIFGPGAISTSAVDIPLANITRQYTLRGEVDPATGKNYANVYPRGW